MRKNNTDIFNTQWPGNCELTKRGFLQLFKIGQINRDRYKDLLNFTHPNPNEVRAFASFSNRTLMTSNALFYGMYLDKNKPIEEQITIPVKNYVTRDGGRIEPIFHYTDRPNCPVWEKYRKGNEKLPEIRLFMDEFIPKHKQAFDEIKTYHERFREDDEVDELITFCDNYISNFYDEREIPLFKKLGYDQKMLQELYNNCIVFNNLKHFYLFYGDKARFISLIVITEYIQNMIYYMDERIKFVSSNQSKLNDNENNLLFDNSIKYVAYSGHDSTIAANYFY